LLRGVVNEFDNCVSEVCSNDFSKTCTDATVVADCCGGDANVCGGIVCQFPSIASIASHVTYFRAISYETLQDGYSVEVASMNDASGQNTFEVTLIVEVFVRDED
jgi:hypothetical protein